MEWVLRLVAGLEQAVDRFAGAFDRAADRFAGAFHGLIHGAADVIPLRSSEFWASGYPDARLFLIEKAGHISQAETPEILFPAVETFLKGIFPAGAKKIDPQR